MAESTQAVGKSDLDSIIGHYLGYGRTSGSWSSDQQADIDQARDAGLARFYDEDWNFMSPETTLTTAADDYDYDLPDDYGSMRETFVFPADTPYGPLRQVSVAQINQMRSTTSASGIPSFFAIGPKSSDGTAGQRFEAIFSPTPDAVYALPYRYFVMQDVLTAGAPYPLGGAMFRNCLIEACLAEAERFFNGVVGEHEGAYQMFYAQAKLNDAKNGPKNLGYMNDTSDLGGLRALPLRYNTYNGALPS